VELLLIYGRLLDKDVENIKWREEEHVSRAERFSLQTDDIQRGRLFVGKIHREFLLSRSFGSSTTRGNASVSGTRGRRGRTQQGSRIPAHDLRKMLFFFCPSLVAIHLKIRGRGELDCEEQRVSPWKQCDGLGNIRIPPLPQDAPEARGSWQIAAPSWR
jgi:hypothetical protein